MDRVDLKSGLGKVNHYRSGEKWGSVCNISKSKKKIGAAVLIV
jgi:hypothetical protein